LKKIRVNFALVLLVAAMIALLLIQGFQTAALYDRKSNEFKERFATVLDRISMRHERAEDIRQYLQIANKDFSVRYKDILKEEFKSLLSAKESISIEDTSIYENGKMESYLIIKGKSYDSLSGVTAEQRVLARDVRQLRDLFNRKPKDQVSQDSIKLAVQLDQRVIQHIFKKARFVNEMMLEAFRNNVYEDPSSRLDIAFLDSVLRTELENENIPHEYEYVVTDENFKAVKFDGPPKNYHTEVDTTDSHWSLLFPSNSLDEDLFIHVNFPKQNSFLIKEMWGALAVNLALVILIVVALTFMFRTILTQKKLSEMKSDFISNMTHEFKTPISTISLACQAMDDTDMKGQVDDSTAPYVKIINDENKRLSVLVERILQSATIDRGELKLKSEEVLLNEVIHDVVDTAQFRITNTGGKIELDLPTELIHITGDKFHTTNVISNLIDNAIKYSKDAPEIKVSLKKEARKVMISISDKGIGMKKEHQNKIFDKLYRIPTGNVHNVKGFGLGLSYVKAIADIEDWDIQVKSKFGSGSEFTITIKH
jgi:two-component system phosphate regulon sensor histidine kinase PhoR